MNRESTGPGADAADLPELFAQAAELSPLERTRFVEALRARLPESAERLSELIAAAERGGSLLDRTAPGLASTVADEPMPERLGPYRILREIGRGGMGRVFLAQQEEEDFRRTVALKVIDRSELSSDRVRRFRDEVRILAALEHPGIARFLDGGRVDGTWFLALEFVEGVDLLEHCRRTGLSIAERVRLFLAVVEAVEYAHGRGVVHRDLKPGNILVGADGRPRLLDFGISKLAEAESGSPQPATTRAEYRVFTPGYASPEQFRGERVTAASDIYSLGAVLYELLTGARPFGEASTPLPLLQAKVLAGDAEPPELGGEALVEAERPCE